MLMKGLMIDTVLS
ncbi:hypothetical protein BpHYR1_036357 [Brachionus plicatilis]|uniref:Uncharacterized protein n=1 Tax=Brachionus plicatilis TaxID=10195 RepID=A0A3M7PGP5_BRAPC|nr:hypothetical protein BpHYR1_036357 [Brachionus plicatilis]